MPGGIVLDPEWQVVTRAVGPAIRTLIAGLDFNEFLSISKFPIIIKNIFRLKITPASNQTNTQFLKLYKRGGFLKLYLTSVEKT